MLARDSPNDLSCRNTADTLLTSPSLPFPGLWRAGRTAELLYSQDPRISGLGGWGRGHVIILANPVFFWRKKSAQRGAVTCPRWQSQRTAELGTPPTPLSSLEFPDHSLLQGALWDQRGAFKGVGKQNYFFTSRLPRNKGLFCTPPPPCSERKRD